MFSKNFGSGPTNTGFNSFGNTQPFAQSDGSNKTLGGGNFGNSQGIYGQRPGTSLFAGRQNPTSLFQSASTSAFGGLGNGQPGFGLSKIFGQQQQQPSSGSVFSTSMFGQQNKTNLFATQLEKGLLGQAQLRLQSPSGFNSAPSTNTFGQMSPFGTSATVQTGTTLKFSAISGTDSIQKGGIATTINTKYHSITCMKEYENKSFEELRVEDYQAQRKGPTQENAMNTSTYNTPATSNTLFNQAGNKLVMPTTFGQTSPAFNHFNTTFSMQSKNNADSLFRQPTTAFSTSALDSISPSFGADTAKAKLMNTQVKPFGDTNSPFQQTTVQQSSFSPGVLSPPGAMPMAGSSLFKNAAQLSTGQSQFSFSKQTVTPNTTFQQDKPGFSMFGQSIPAATSNFNKGITFGQQQSPFDSNTSGKPFGSLPVTGATPFGTTLGVTAQQPAAPMLFAQPELKTNALNIGNSASVGHFHNMAPQSQLTTVTTPHASILPFPTTNSADTVLRLANSQFPFSPHLAGLTPVPKSESSSYPGNRVVSPTFWSPRERITTTSPKLNVTPIYKTKKSSLFDSPEDNMYENYVKKNDRRLIIKKKVKDDSIFNDSDEEILEKIKSFHEKNSLKNQVEETVEEFEDATVVADVAVIDDSVQDEDTKEATMSPEKQVEEDDLDETAEKHYPCGIILERPEYFTIPPLTDIEQFKNEDGSCFIKGFTIGRIGYGSVHFPDIMDVSNLNLDAIVFFRYKEVTIYPETYPNKPPVGQGLNREAQITLDHVYPEIRGKRITELNELLKLGYIEKLRDSCLRQGCQFLEYRVESGSWVFKVKHFTTYGEGSSVKLPNSDSKFLSIVNVNYVRTVSGAIFGVKKIPI